MIWRAMLEKGTWCVTGFVILWLSACSVGPNYLPPTASVPMDWSHSGNKQSAPQSNSRWWRHFHDPILNELVEQKAVCGLDVKSAHARFEIARAEYAAAYAQLLPRASANLLPPDGTGTGLAQLLMLSASIEPDLFGKQRENSHAAFAKMEAEQASRDFTLMTLQAEIATTYLELREAQRKDDIIRHNLMGNKQLIVFLNSRYKAGLNNYLDIAQQDALISTQWAELEQNSALNMMLLHKIELLTGNNPGFLAKRLLPHKPVPQMRQRVNLGIPSELLRRRPDIIAAERRVAAAHANIRVATANLFPQVTVGWLLAWQGETLASNIFAMKNLITSFLGTFNAPMVNLPLHRMVNVREREKVLAVLQYEIAVMRALHDVETQYNYCLHYEKSAGHLKHAVTQKRLVLKLAKNVYQKGATDFNTVLRSEEDLNRLEIAYLHQMVMYQIAKINLYKALGYPFSPFVKGD